MKKKCELNVPRMPQMAGELTALPHADPLAGFRGEGRDGGGRDRPAHFLVAFAAYDSNSHQQAKCLN